MGYFINALVFGEGEKQPEISSLDHGKEETFSTTETWLCHPAELGDDAAGSGEYLAVEGRETARIQPSASPRKSLKQAIVIGELLVSWASSPLLKALPVALKERLVINIYILKISALTSVKLERQRGRGGGKAGRKHKSKCFAAPN